MGLFSAIGDALQTGANGIRDATLSKKELQDRKMAKQILKIIKVVVILLALVAFFSFVAAPTIASFSGMVISAFFAKETFQVATNLLEIFDSAMVELSARLDAGRLAAQVGKGTIVAKWIIKEWISPHWEPPLTFLPSGASQRR